MIESCAIFATFALSMKQPDLIQSRLLRKLELTLEPDGILVHDKGLGRSQKVHINYEQIPPKAQEITIVSKKLYGWAIIVTVLTLVCIPVAFASKGKDDALVPLFWGGIAFVFWVAAFASKKSLVIYSQNNAQFVLFRNLPSPEAVDTFLKKLFMFRNACLQKKYGRFLNEESLESKLKRLTFLRAQEVITEEAFEAKRDELLKGNKPAGPLGFTAQ
jgi:hypothetical protein